MSPAPITGQQNGRRPNSRHERPNSMRQPCHGILLTGTWPAHHRQKIRFTHIATAAPHRNPASAVQPRSFRFGNCASSPMMNSRSRRAPQSRCAPDRSGVAPDRMRFAVVSTVPRRLDLLAPYRVSGDDHRDAVIAVSEEGSACTKAVCNYIYQTYGRFPATVDAMHLMWLMQAHHLDTDYYDRFFRPGAYGSTHAAHVATWHP